MMGTSFLSQFAFLLISSLFSMGHVDPAPTVAPPAEFAPIADSVPEAKNSMTSEEYAALMKNAYVEGNRDAKVTLVEYSDLECPFCIRQYQDGTIAKLREKYGNKINVVYKPLNLARHPGSDQKGMAALCVARIGGTEKYAKFYKEILGRSNMYGPVFALDKVKDLAKEVGVDPKKFADCYDGKKTQELYESDTAEALKYGVQGTPTTMILNNVTRKFELVQGAADASSFYPVVDRVMQ